MFNILQVGGGSSLRKALADIVDSKRDCSLKYLADVKAAKDLITRSNTTLVIFHIPVGDELELVGKGTEFLISMAIAGKRVPTIMIMERPSADLTLCFLQLGATECLCRPLSADRLSFLIDIITASSLRPKKATEATANAVEPTCFWQSSRMSSLLDEIRLVARLETTVLLSGETGTGKTFLARFIHACSPHRHTRFVTVNCGTLTPTLVESELFGHRRGAFTGAERDHVGKFALAGRGTLFLDDVDTLPLEVQTKFLRAIEERKFEPVGAEETQQFQARVVAATNRDLESEVTRGRFRSDLYYRLNVASFRLPPLRERDDEIEGLAKYFGSTLASEHGLGRPQFSASVAAVLQSYDWPGNIRELRNTIEHCLIVSSGGEIDVQHLPECVRRTLPTPPRENSTETNPRSRSLKTLKSCAERDHIVAALLHNNNNNRSRTAEELGISRAALYKKLHKYNLT